MSLISDKTDRRVEFEADGETLRIRDALEGEELLLHADREFDPQPALTELFPFPVDRAVSFETGAISIPAYSNIKVRDVEGEFVARLDEPTELPRSSYCVEINGVTKALVRVTDVEITTTGMTGTGPVELSFDRPRTVTVGARSLHTRPEAAITVPDDPAALVNAVSVLGSSIKEFSPERSWPTLRGYPPRFERGDHLEIPSPLIAPETGIDVVVRPTYADIYRLSTLTYYLGGKMVIGDTPAIRLDTGYVEPLPADGIALEERAEELLRTWFFLDTLARTEGYTPSDRYEYEQAGPELPFYPPNLADLSMSERLMEYLEVDPETVAPYTPEWPTAATLRPNADAMTLLPHLAHALAPIRVRGSVEPPRPDAPSALGTSPWLAPDSTVPNPDADPLPTGASVLTPTGYENRLRRTKTACNEARVAVMVDSAARAGDIRTALSDPFVPEGIGSWEVIDRPDQKAVVELLGNSDFDVVHCGLPVEGDCVIASDGPVVLDDLEDAPTLTVFEKTSALSPGSQCLSNGGLLGVLCESAIDPGQLRRLFALLAVGTPADLSLSISIPNASSSVRIVGDPNSNVTSNRGLTTIVCSVRSVSATTHEVKRTGALSQSTRIGSQYRMILDGFEEHDHLTGIRVDLGERLTGSQLVNLFDQPDAIVCLNGKLILPGDGLTTEEITESARRALAEGRETHCLPPVGAVQCNASNRSDRDRSSTD